MKRREKLEIREDVWVPTLCAGCYACCHVRVRRTNGIAVQIEGEPDTFMGGKGGICGKAIAEIQALYNPYRLNYPVKRTNPQKGLGVDPKWKRISWDEAYSEIVEKVNRVRQDNPLKIFGMGGPSHGTYGHAILSAYLIQAFGSHHFSCGGAGLQCGNASHLLAGMNHCSWSIVPDFKYCNYVIHFGITKGTGAGHSAASLMRLAAEARARGMKTVVFDPICNFPGGKAREWIPIIPGTDGAVALSMANVLVNDLNIYDQEYLEKKTNAPYLVNPEGTYVRNEEGEPLLWDITDNRAKVWNDFTLKISALDGIYEVFGIKCQPVFALLKEHLKEFTPEWAEEISTVPAVVIRRISKEYGENACIGASIEIEGVKLPYRPVSCLMFRGGSGHTNGFQSYVAVDLLNHLVGACEVPGGTIGWPARVLGKRVGINIDYEPVAQMDGFLRASSWPTILPGTWPHNKPKPPIRLDLMEIFTCSSFSAVPFLKEAREIWNKFNLNYDIEVLFTVALNPVLTTANVDVMADLLSRIPFHVDINIFPTETNEGFADIVLPEASWLESYEIMNSEIFHFNAPTGMEDFVYRIRQPVVQPLNERKMLQEILEELANRAGVSRVFHAFLNYNLHTTGGESTFLPEDDLFLPMEKFVDTWLKSRFGPDRGIEWLLKKKNNTVQWKKIPEETYWRWFIPARSSICYNEFLIEQKEHTHKILSSVGISLDYDQYTPYPSYFKTVPLKSENPQYDLILISTRDILHTGTSSGYLPWVIEATEINPFTMKIAINVKTAMERGIIDGDMVWIENDRGDKAKGLIRTIEGIHPKVVAITGFGGGRFVRGAPLLNRLEGILTNRLIPAEWGDFCPITMNLETSAKVRVYKGEGKKGC